MYSQCINRKNITVSPTVVVYRTNTMVERFDRSTKSLAQIDRAAKEASVLLPLRKITLTFCRGNRIQPSVTIAIFSVVRSVSPIYFIFAIICRADRSISRAEKDRKCCERVTLPGTWGITRDSAARKSYKKENILREISKKLHERNRKFNKNEERRPANARNSTR